jgi:NADH-ubiquinone oxidoreductase chain 5
VALSTLRQLGLIFTALGAGLKEEAFFHLLTHAYFKALLFIAVGNAIHLSKSFQDLRQVGISPLAYPFTLRVALLANLSLAGVPFLSGFYSKDLIIEMSLGASSSLPGFFVLLSSVAVTAAYTCRLLNLICGRLHSPRGAFPARDNSPPVIKATAWLAPFAVFGGSLLSWYLLPSPSGVFLPGELKVITLVLIVVVISLSSMLPWHSKQPRGLNWGGGGIWGIPPVSRGVVTACLFPLRHNSRKIDLS